MIINKPKTITTNESTNIINEHKLKLHIISPSFVYIQTKIPTQSKRNKPPKPRKNDATLK